MLLVVGRIGRAHGLRGEVLVDVRLESGLDPAWEKLYTLSGRQNDRARLGLQLLRALILRTPGLPEVTLHRNTTINPKTVAVHSVETFAELEDDLKELRIEHYLHKDMSQHPGMLVKFLEAVAPVDAS